MGKKGGNKKTKALVAPKAVNIKRKEKVWTVHTQPGAHKRDKSVALGIVLRDISMLAKTMKEAKAILCAGEVKVNGIVKKETQFGVGLFDAIEIAGQKLFFRVMLDKKGRFILKNLENKSNEKIVRVEYKKATSKGVQITTDDSRVYFTNEAKVGDSLKISVPDGKIQEVLPMQKGATVYITKGEHCSETATVTDLIVGTIRRTKLVKLKNETGDFETIPQNMYVIGKDKPAIGDLK